MPKSSKPCNFITETKEGKEVVFNYDQMRQFLLDNPEMWKGIEGLRTKAKGAKKAAVVKAMPQEERPTAMPYVPEVIPAANEEQKAGEVEVEALKKGDKITTSHPIQLLKGIEGKRLPDGTPFTAHEGVKGTFSAIKEKIARRYEGEKGILVFEIPAGVTVEAVQIANTPESKGLAGSVVRKMETDAINDSDAQVVKLITTDSRGPETQYIIKDPALRKLGYRPSEKAKATKTNADIANRIRSKKQKGALSAIDFGISVTVYNGALDFMASQVEKGTKLGNAIANTIKWIDEKMKGEKWNKGAFGKYMNDTYSVTLPNGREVEVVRDDTKETAEVVNGWYSEVEQKILDSKEDKLPAATWMKRLKSKEDEDFWTGVRGFLEGKNPGEQVSKKELRDWMKDNRVEISEVVKEQEKKPKSLKRFDDIVETLKSRGYGVDVQDYGGGDMSVRVDNTEDDYLDARSNFTKKEVSEMGYKPKDTYEEDLNLLREANDIANRLGTSADRGDVIVETKFSQYQLEGDKSNYKEVLVTLPQKISIPDGKYIVYVDKGINEKREYVKGFDTTQEASKWIAENEDKYSSYSLDYEDRKIVLSIEEPESTFRSSHFAEPNILVHLRMNTRTDADGNKVLFLEEVQSDWGQKGKKVGFEIKEEDRWNFEPIKRNGEIVAWKIELKLDNNIGGIGNTKQDAIADANKRYGVEINSLEKTQVGVPAAPFVTDTNAWTKLGLKVALREAVKQGVDKIAWTTGEQQNDRYDLSKSVSNIQYAKLGNKYLLSVTDKKGDEILYNTQMTIQEVENYLGKDIAEKIQNGIGEEKPAIQRSVIDLKSLPTIEGEGLKVGGKGMKGFYGSPSEGNLGIVGSVAKSLFKQEPGTVKINNVTQNSIDITPEMRESVEKGLPLFGTKIDPVIKFLDSLKTDPNIIGLNAGLWNGFVEAVKAAWNISNSAAKAIQAGIDWLKAQKEDPSEWEKYIAPVRTRLQEMEQAPQKAEEKPEAPKPPKPPVTPPPTEGKATPEGEEKQVPKTVVGRRYRVDSKEMQDALEEIGLYRTPGSREEAQKKADNLVQRVGWDAAMDVARNENIDGLYKVGIGIAVLESIEDKRNATKDVEEYAQLTKKAAEVTDQLSSFTTLGGQILNMWTAFLQNASLPFDYTSRKKAFIEKFGVDAYTKELQERFESLDKQYKDVMAKYTELEEQKAAWERQSIVDSELSKPKEEPAQRKSFFKQAAERVRKLRIAPPGLFQSATPASLAWDASIEAVAIALEGLGTLEVAIAKGVEKLRDSEWYRGLSNSKKTEAENQFRNEVEKAYIPEISVDEETGKVVLPAGTIKAYVEAGFRDAEEIIDHIHNQAIQKNPDITKRDVRDAMLTYGKKHAPTNQQLRDQVQEVKNISKLLSAIEDVNNGLKKAKTEKSQKAFSDRRKNLIQQYETLYKNVFGHKPSQPSDETRYGTIKRNLEKEIERIKEMKPRPERRPPIKYDAELEALAAEKYRLQEEWDAEFAKEEANRKAAMSKVLDGLYAGLNLTKTAMTGADLGVILIQGLELMFRNAKVTGKAFKTLGKTLVSEAEYRRHIGEIRNSEFYRIMRKSGLDFQSPVGKLIKPDEGDIESSAEAIYEFMTAPLKYIPKVGEKAYDVAQKLNLIRALNRGQTSFMNTLKVGSYMLSYENLQAKGISFYDNPEAYKDVATAINTIAGRGKIGGIEKDVNAMKFLNLIFFSARNWASVLTRWTPIIYPIYLATKRAGAEPYRFSESQKIDLMTKAKFIATTAALMYSLYLLTGGDEDEEEKMKEGNISIDLKNPQSSAFNKVRIGNQVFDPWGGRMQIITLEARLMINMLGGYAYKDPLTGIEKKLPDSYFKTPGGLMLEYAKGKLGPVAKTGMELAFTLPVPGRPWYYRRPVDGGKDFFVLEPVKESVTNITIESLMELYGNQPLTTSEIMTLFLIAGGGVTTLGSDEDITTVSKIRNLLAPDEDELKKFKKAFSNYLKAGDYDMAEKIFDKATGTEKMNQSIQLQQEMGKQVSAERQKLENKRRKSARELFDNVALDNLLQKYNFEKKYRDEVIEAVYNNKVFPVNVGTPKRKEIISRINSLTTEMKDDIKRNYDVQYNELITVAKGLDKVSKNLTNYYEKKANRTPWVRQYLKLTKKGENKK